MPNVITHGLMAHEVIQNCESSSLSQAIENNLRLFFFGSNGPDFLFYYRFLSSDEDAQAIRHLGGIFHDEHVNDFYSAAKTYLSTLSGPKYEMTLSYLSGHLCHWALDSLAHPYVFHKTGLIEGDTRYDHYRFEAMVDTLVVKQIQKKKFADVPSYKFVELKQDEVLVIAKLYQYITKVVLNKRVELSKFVKAIKAMYQYNRLLWDKRGLKTKVIRQIENKVLKDPWIYSSHFVIPQEDLEHDLLNLNHEPWSHPCDETEIYTESFMDLFDQSIIRGVIALNKLLDDTHTHQHSLEDYLDNRNYSSGKSSPCLMVNFNIIYEH